MKKHLEQLLGRRWMILAAVTALLGILYLICTTFFYKQMNDPGPEITFDRDFIEVSVNVSREELLAGVTAIDKRDGDVSSSIVIEGLSPLMDDHSRIVTYAAFDRDNQVGKAQRRIQYTDYTPIRFSLETPLTGLYSNWNVENLLKPLKASDCLDGDLTNQIFVTSWSWATTSDEYRMLMIDVQVINSAGEMASLTLPIRLQVDDSYKRNYNAEIALESYLVYHPVGTPFDSARYFKEASVVGDIHLTDGFTTETSLDVNTPGLYVVTYAIEYKHPTRNDTYYASCDLIVVVE